MGYAFDNPTNIPDSENEYIAIMNAKSLDGFLNPQEQAAKDSVKPPKYVCLVWTGRGQLIGVFANEDLANKYLVEEYYKGWPVSAIDSLIQHYDVIETVEVRQEKSVLLH